jgi:hypothetical protein
MEKLSGYRYLLHFNGDTFDIPFVRKRIQHANLSARISKDGRLSIPDFFDDLQSVDLYKMIKPFKNALGLENLKQKTIEEYLGLHRIDTYNGGELIQVYHSFLSQPTQRLQSLLLQHNRDDMEGMYVLSSILSLRALADGKLKFRDISCEETSQGMLRLRFGFLLDHSLPIRITASLGHIHLNAYQNAGYLLVPILSDELKHFFPDYKNYYYYPELDTAYHQSVDLRSETLLRERAKKANCYIRCYGHFIPQLSLSVCDGFRRTAADKESYLEVNDSFLGDRERLALYTGKMCGLLLRAK